MKKLTIPEGGIFDVGNKEINKKSASTSTKKETDNSTKNNKAKAESTASENESSSASTQTESKMNTESNQSASKFKIKKGSRNARRTTVTYRLNTSTIDGIEEIASAARKSINETVQELLDWAIENVEIE